MIHAVQESIQSSVVIKNLDCDVITAVIKTPKMLMKALDSADEYAFNQQITRQTDVSDTKSFENLMLFRYRPRNREVLVYMKFPYKSGATNQNK
jgi:hypothetical protein